MAAEEKPRALTDLSEGVDWVGKLVSASAVLVLVSHAVTVPMSHWLAAALDGYAALFHPLVDNTIGLVPKAFGWALKPGAKDAIVLYSVLASSVFRTFSRFTRGADERPGWLQLSIYALSWPILPYGFFVLWVFGRLFPGQEGSASYLAKAIARQLLWVVAIVLLAILANAASVL